MAAKDFEVGGGVSLTAALTAGFLCWQVDNGRQNDAVMYGAALGVRSPYVDFAVDYGGYTGWKDGQLLVLCRAAASFIDNDFFFHISLPMYSLYSGDRCLIGSSPGKGALRCVVLIIII